MEPSESVVIRDSKGASKGYARPSSMAPGCVQRTPPGQGKWPALQSAAKPLEFPVGF